MQPAGNYQPIPGEYVVPSAPPSYAEATYGHQPYPQPPQPYPPPPQPYPPQPGMEAKPLNPVPPYVVQPMPMPMQTPVTVQTVYVQQPVRFHDRPVQICCPRCNTLTTTRIDHTSGALAWLSCGGLCILGCGFGCCLIPFCIDSLKDVDHYCSNCQALIGSYKRI
ncbi:lipopolysaccharide-induced tumor necrosis factor-alpha factor [Bufo gargarizans]|uniref:lipopolysaccharide-induced tumor necrosis factor-alpha factor n=1 Tax=Bufo gargarizans TaxID=30331 RepID=UPI001CF2A7A2|nr:lipopolysaccharide-induced tumor necrosis factor-alpha factor [Bufo gargarizans]